MSATSSLASAGDAPPSDVRLGDAPSGDARLGNARLGDASPGAPAADAVTPYREAVRQLLRDSLLDAAADLIEERGWERVTMGSVAKAAGVSRQTLYKAFGSRADFAQAYALRAVDRFLDAVRIAVGEHLDDPATALSVAFDTFLTSAAHDPFVRAILADDGSHGLLPIFTTHGRPVIERSVHGLAAIVRSGWPQVDATDAELLSELLVRLAISHAGLPTRPAGMTASSLARVLSPYIDQLLAQAAEPPRA